MYLRFLSLLACVFISAASVAQNEFRAQVFDAETNTPLYGANAVLEGTSIGATANKDGIITIENIPNGEQTIVFSYVGFEKEELILTFPLEDDSIRTVHLHHEGEHMEEVIISATRSRRTIADLPTRVEVISGEELSEKGNMKPGDIRKIGRAHV